MGSAARQSILVLLAFLALSCVRGAERDPFLVLVGPKDVVRIDLTGEEGETVWVLEAQIPQSLDRILYGTVPSGFKQLEPADGLPPRALQPGELLTARTRTLKRIFTHVGVARTDTSMEILNYSMELRTEK